MATLQSFWVATTLLLHLLTFSQIRIATSTKLTKLSLNLTHILSPDSPFYQSNLTQHERIERMIQSSVLQSNHLESISSPHGILTPEKIGITILRQKFILMVRIALGTPSQQVLLNVDTGGGLTWTQCRPCPNCYPQRLQIYNSAISRTYRKLPCSNPICSGPRSPYQCVNQECVYSINYSDGSYTRGIASLETALAGSRNFPGVIFGCSNDNKNDVYAQDGVISGKLGLNMAPDSVLTQLFVPTKRRFSYCLVPFSTEASLPASTLLFGDDIPRTARNVQSTRFLDWSYAYRLNLLDISVGRVRLGFPPGTFTIRRDGNGGCSIDSDTVMPEIDTGTVGRNAYQEVLRAFQNYYASFHLKRDVPPNPVLKLCYQKPANFNEFASMTYHFAGADYFVDPMFVHYFYRSGSFCVALKAGSTRTILGAWHQQNMRIIYDAHARVLQFAPENCAP